MDLKNIKQLVSTFGQQEDFSALVYWICKESIRKCQFGSFYVRIKILGMTYRFNAA
jgi:hypothetical protein